MEPIIRLNYKAEHKAVGRIGSHYWPEMMEGYEKEGNYGALEMIKILQGVVGVRKLLIICFYPAPSCWKTWRNSCTAQPLRRQL